MYLTPSSEGSRSPETSNDVTEIEGELTSLTTSSYFAASTESSAESVIVAIG